MVKFVQMIAISSILAFSLTSIAAETGCKPFSQKELGIIRASQDLKLLVGAALMDSTPTLSKEFFDLAARIESPKGVATFCFIDTEFERVTNENPLDPLVRERILQLLNDEKENALPYYLYAVLQQKTVGNGEALLQVRKGNSRNFHSYSRERFEAIVGAAGVANCTRIEARRYAFSAYLPTSVYGRLRRLCRELLKTEGDEARTGCHLMGQNLERRSLTFIEQLLSLSIQADSLGHLPSDSPERKSIEEKRKAIANRVGRAPDVACGEVPEDVDSKYYDLLLNKGEASAQDFIDGFLQGRPVIRTDRE